MNNMVVKQKALRIPRLANSKFSLIGDLDFYERSKKRFLDKDYCYSFFKQATINENQMKNIIFPFLSKNPKKLLTILKNIKEIYANKIECIYKLQNLSYRLANLGNQNMD